MVFPWISFLQERKKRLSDIEYLAVQESNGNVTRTRGAINTVTSKITHTVTTGKDGYILVAKIIITDFSNSSAVRAACKIAGTTIDTTQIGVRAFTQEGPTTNGFGMGGWGIVGDGILHGAIGDKATAGQTIDIENTLDNGSADATLVVLEVDTGVSPAL